MFFFIQKWNITGGTAQFECLTTENAGCHENKFNVYGGELNEICLDSSEQDCDLNIKNVYSGGIVDTNNDAFTSVVNLYGTGQCRVCPSARIVTQNPTGLNIPSSSPRYV